MDEFPEFEAELSRVLRHSAPETYARKVFSEAVKGELKDGHHILRCVGDALLNELTLAQCGHRVFYRVITQKMIPYEINTVLLHLMGHTVREHDSAPLSLIPSPCIMEAVYPTSMKHLMRMFKTREICSDMSDECTEFLISTNCILVPSGHDGAFHKLAHVLEAPPTRFYQGYDITQWVFTMRETLEKILGMDRSAAETLLGQIDDLYNAQFNHDDTESHLLQISIPVSQVERFAYMSVAYGYPVKVLEGANGKRKAYLWNDAKQTGKALHIHQILESPEAAKLQTRIIAHPNLFLLHGATVSVASAHAGYDRKRFQDGVLALLAPHACKMAGVALNKFV